MRPARVQRPQPDHPIQQAVRHGVAAIQSFSLDGTPFFVVGMPIPSVHAEFYEVFDLSDLTTRCRYCCSP